MHPFEKRNQLKRTRLQGVGQSICFFIFYLFIYLTLKAGVWLVAKSKQGRRLGTDSGGDFKGRPKKIRTMDRIPKTGGDDANPTDLSIDRQASPPVVSFEERIAESKDRSAQIAAGVMLASVGVVDGGDGNGGDGDGNSITTSNGRSSRTRNRTPLAKLKHVLMTFGKFVGPGFMVSVAYSKFKSLSPRCEEKARQCCSQR